MESVLTESKDAKDSNPESSPKLPEEYSDDSADNSCGEDECPLEESEPSALNFISPRPKPQNISHPSGKKPKLRTSKDIFDRLKWDSESILLESLKGPLELSSVYIGYKDRFLGMCEIPFESFAPLPEGQGEIPFHRIYYFRTGGPPIDPFVGRNGEVKVREDNLPPESTFIWDRDARIDLLFHSGDSSKS